MFLQLLASELLKAPEINEDVVEAEKSVKRITAGPIETIEDLEELGRIRIASFNFEQFNRSIDLPTFESALIRAKHYTSAELELEEDFV